MAQYSQILATFAKKIRPYLSFFAVEILLIFIMFITAGVNIGLRTNSDSNTGDQSLFFVLLKNRPELNQELVAAYDEINVRVTGEQNPLQQVLAAGTLKKTDTNMNSGPPLPTLAGTALLKPNPATSDGLLPKRDIEVYTVKGGDTVARIAATFGVSTDTVLWENDLSAASLIKPGQELRILPTSGIKHVVKSGENMYSIAKKYDVDLEAVLEYNQIEIPEHIFSGEEIIIPNGVKKAPPTPARRSYLASLQRQDYETANVDADFHSSSTGFVWPLPAARRLSQSYWSRHRAVDIPCRGCEIVAAADGVVELSGWQGGYGYTIVVNHGNGVKTRYAHGSRLYVSAGTRVSQGQAIMVSGSTGRSTGPHLHFEIIKNGVYLNPLSVF